MARFKVQILGFGQVARIFFLNQNDIVLVIKKYKSRCNRVFDGVTSGFFSLIFSSARVDPPGWVSKLWFY